MARPKGRTVLLVSRSECRVRKLRVLQNDAGSMDFELESEHDVDGETCSCAGYHYRKTCTHLEAWRGPTDHVPVSVTEALAVARSVQEKLSLGGCQTTAVEGLDRDEAGLVTRIRLVTNHPHIDGRAWTGTVSVDETRSALVRIRGTE